jgi:hypothetical protein
MINKEHIIPDNTIAVFIPEKNNALVERLDSVLLPSPKKRDWFNSHFYRCLPLTIGNQYGFIVKTEFPFAYEWDGGDSPDAVKLYFPKETDSFYPRIETHFGHGIISINPPWILRTPPNVNLMTINPPNYVIPNITVMTGVVETDNLRRNFLFNLKIQVPNMRIELPAGTPLAAFIPIPRFYVDKFNLVLASDLFDKDVIEEELKAADDATEYRNNVELTLPHNVGKHYLKGTDLYGNQFLNHQRT